MTRETAFSKDLSNKKLRVEKSFNADQDQVWNAWTEAEVLDQWWAPKPYKAETKKMDFKPGGVWLYGMVSPKGETQWCRADIKTVDAKRNFTWRDAFCDEDGNPINTLPRSNWDVKLSKGETGTEVKIELSFDQVEDLEAILKMGFEEGFKAGLNNLTELLAKS